MNLIENTVKYIIIEVSNTDKAIGLIVADGISKIDGDMVYINNAVVKHTINKKETIRTLGERYPASSNISSSLYGFGVRYSGMMLPKSRIISIVMVDDLDDLPDISDIKLWSSRTKQQAEDMCDEELAKIKQEHEVDHPFKFSVMEDNWKISMAKDKAHDMWDSLPWYKKMFKDEHRYRIVMADSLVGDMIPDKLYKILSDAGFSWEEWIKRS